MQTLAIGAALGKADEAQELVDGTLAGAIYITSPLSLRCLLDELVPALATAVAGDPSTIRRDGT